MENNDFNFVRLGSKPISRNMEITKNKMFTQIFSQAIENTKSNKCYFCEKNCTSFCNSHSIPRFALARIAEKGKIVSLIDYSLNPSKESRGVNNTGTFHIICNDCDSKIFNDYENPNGYDSMPSNAILSQIALKNYLQLIWKRTCENEFYRILKTQHNSRIADEKIFWGEKDLTNYSKEYAYAKKALGKNESSYYLCFFKQLDYVIPYAAQAAITLIGDLEDVLINNIYRDDIDNQTSCIHIMALPLKEKSVILAFIKDRDKRYRNFYKQLRKLPLEEQLATINYIIFCYTENIFINPTLAKTMNDNKTLLDVCNKTTDYTTDIYNYNANPIERAIKEFSLSQRTLIPNLLSKEYSL